MKVLIYLYIDQKQNQRMEIGNLENFDKLILPNNPDIFESLRPQLAGEFVVATTLTKLFTLNALVFVNNLVGKVYVFYILRYEPSQEAKFYS